MAPAVTVFHGLAFLRGVMIAAAPRSAIASWPFRVSQAPSVAPAPVCLQTVRGGCDTGDVLIGVNLGQQFEQHGRIAHVAAGDHDRPDL